MWSWSYGSWIYNYLCNQCLSPLTLWVQIPFSWWGVLDTTLCDKVCQWLATGRWVSLGTSVFSTNRLTATIYSVTARLLKVTLNTINQTIKINQILIYPVTSIFIPIMDLIALYFSLLHILRCVLYLMWDLQFMLVNQ